METRNAVFFAVPTDNQEALKVALQGSGVETVFVPEVLNAATLSLARDAEIISVFVGCELRREQIDALPNLKFITTRSVGYDHIDVTYAKEKGITVSNVPAYGTHTVAEFAFALILAVSRKVVAANTRLHTENSFDQAGLTGFDLFGKTMGIVGTGKIGKNVGRIAKGLGMRVIAYDLFPDMAYAAEVGVTYVSLEELLSQVDVISLHAPNTTETFHLLNRERLSKVKRGVVLVNTARGELIDSEALLWALSEGLVSGAGLDVIEGERYLKEGPQMLTNTTTEPMETTEGYRTMLAVEELIHHPCVVATPHIAYASVEAKREILAVTAENIRSFVEGVPQNVIA